MPDIDLAALAAYFDESEIEWKPVAVSKKTNKALAAAYVTNRAVQQRLDDVVGPARWQNQFREGPAGGVLCGLSIEVEPDKWVTKWDGAENTDIESVKGGLSDSQRRAAVQWGIGRYLYNVPSQWVPVDENGRFREPPRMNPAFLPGAAPKNGQVPASQERETLLGEVEYLLDLPWFENDERAKGIAKAEAMPDHALPGYVEKLREESTRREREA